MIKFTMDQGIAFSQYFIIEKPIPSHKNHSVHISRQNYAPVQRQQFRKPCRYRKRQGSCQGITDLYD